MVAFSGGADSAFLAWVASDALGPAAVAVTAVSPSLAPDELDDCRALAAEWRLRLARGRHPRDGRRAVPGQRRRPVRLVQDRPDGCPGSVGRDRGGDGGARGERRRPGRPPTRPARRGPAGGGVPPRRGGSDQGRRPPPLSEPRAAHVGQARGRLPRVPHPVRHARGPHDPRPGGSGRVRPAAAGLRRRARPPLRRHRPHRGARRAPRRRGRGPRRGGRRRAGCRLPRVTLDLEGLRSGNLNADLRWAGGRADPSPTSSPGAGTTLSGRRARRTRRR